MNRARRDVLIRLRPWLLGSLFLLMMALGIAGQSAADDPNQAGLVVQSGDGQVETLCIEFEEPQVSGFELLTSSGLEMIVDASGGMGLTVCQIGEVGCEHPAEPCFCQCMGGEPCVYWNYYYRDPGESEWTYSPLGAALRKVQPGAVEAWVWGDGQTPPGNGLTFEAICSPVTPTPTIVLPSSTLAATAEIPTSTSVAHTATATTAVTATPSRPPVQQPADTSTAVAPMPESAPSTASDAGGNLAAFLPFGLIVLGLAAVGVFVWSRRS